MKKILIIDDERKILDLYTRLLTSEGYEVLQAHDAREGTFILMKLIMKEDQVDLILLDINMPEVSGVCMREVINELDDKCQVMISSVYPLDDQKKMVSKAKDYFDKSQGTDVLVEKVNRILKYV